MLNSEKQWSSLTFPLSFQLTCQVVVLFLSYVTMMSKRWNHRLSNSNKMTIQKKKLFMSKNLMEQQLKFCLTLCYCSRHCLHRWSLQVWWCTPTLISVFWIMHLKNGTLLCHMKMTKQLRISNPPLKNGSIPYCLIMHSLPKKSGWQILWRSLSSWY